MVEVWETYVVAEVSRYRSIHLIILLKSSEQSQTGRSRECLDGSTPDLPYWTNKTMLRLANAYAF